MARKLKEEGSSDDESETKPETKPESKKRAKVPETETPKAQSALQRFMGHSMIDKLTKKVGEGTITSAADFKDIAVRIPTGIFRFDVALGGGWPIGRVMHIFGRKSSGKTTTVLRGLAQVQRSCGSCWRQFREMPAVASPPSYCPCGAYREPLCGWIDAEATFDKEWAKTLGVDIGRMAFVRPLSAEEAVDLADTWIRSGEMDFLVIDSIAYIVPQAVQDKEAEAANPGVHARLIGKMVHKLLSGSILVQRQESRFPTVFLLNQIREKIPVSWGPGGDTTTGGNSPGFFASIEVLFKQGKTFKDDATGMPLYTDHDFKIEKNKMAPTAKMEGTFRLIKSDMATKKKGHIADEEDVVDAAHEVNLITGAGSSWYCFEEHFGAKSAITKRMLTDQDFSDRLRAETLKILLAAM